MGISAIKRIFVNSIQGQFLFLFLLVTSYLGLKTIKNFIFFFDRLFYFPEIFLVLACFVVIYFAGRQIKNIFNFENVSTGVVAFFCSTFVVNIFLGVFRLSSPKVETLFLFFILFVLFTLELGAIKSVKHKTYFVLAVVCSFIVIKLLPATAFIEKPPYLGDEQYFWHPSTVAYFQKGLLQAVLQSPIAGYGLFVQHVWVTIKKLAFFNDYSLNAFYFMPKVLFCIGLLFISELKISKITKLLLFIFFISYVFTHAWVQMLLMNSLMGEGVTALFFAIILNEIINKGYFSENSKITPSYAFFWFAAGVLYITKPFVSYMVLLLPVLVVTQSGFLKNKKLLFKKFFVAFIFIFVGYFLWQSIHKINGHSLTAVGFEIPKSVDIGQISRILKHWFADRLSTLLFIVGFVGIIVGTNKGNLKQLLICSAIVFMNLFLVFLLYAVFWAGYSDIESAFRYFLIIYYVAIIALGISIESVVNKSLSFLKARA